MALGLGVGIPFQNKKSDLSFWTMKSLFFLDGTIITVGENRYFKDRSTNARNFLITGYDFDSTWTKGFPYKSAATISAPAGDAVLIAADVNNFLYAGDGTPNQIPVVSLFQNIDYANTIYCKHVAQVVDANGVETTEPHVLEIYMAKTAESGSGLTKANTYFGVPAKVVTNVKWIDAVSGSDSAPNDGTEAKPYKTFAKAIAGVTSGGTIYVKTGDLNEACTISNKGVDIIGLGFTKNSKNSGATWYHANNTTNPLKIKGFICVGTAGQVFRIEGTTANVTIEKCQATATTLFYGTTASTDVTCTVKDCVLNGKFLTLNITTLALNTNRIASVAIPVALGVNLVSTNNKYIGSTSTIIQRHQNTTSISLLGDVVTGSLFTDEAKTGECAITVNRCRLAPDTAGAFMSLINAASKVTFAITNNTIAQSLTTSTTAFTLKGYNITFTGNTVTGQNGTLLSAVALAASKTLTFSGNRISSVYTNVLSSTDYTLNCFNNTIVSGVYTQIIATSVNQSNIPASIYNNYIASKTAGGAAIILGTEYSTTIDGRLNGSAIYNNRISGPADWGNDPGAMHAVFAWSQAASWYNNYLSGTLLGFVLKSNGGTFANAIHHNIIKDTSMSFTIKGIKGTLIYNNVCYEAHGYDGLSENHAGTEGDSGSSTIKNNIFYNTDAAAVGIYIESAANATGMASDKNIFWNPNHEHVAAILPTQYTLADWKTAGYDTNSSESNPNLNTSGIPAAKIEGGETLDAAYDDGLDVSTNWGDANTVPAVVTKQQGANWQMGAYVI